MSVRDNNFPEKQRCAQREACEKERTLRVRCWQVNPEAMDGSSAVYVPSPENGCSFRMQKLAQKKHALGTTGGWGKRQKRCNSTGLKKPRLRT